MMSMQNTPNTSGEIPDGYILEGKLLDAVSTPNLESVARCPTFTNQYGIVSSSRLDERVERVHGIVEKTHPDVAPSTLAVVGRYVLSPRIFHHLQNDEPGAGGEIQLADGIFALMDEAQLLAYRFNGVHYTYGAAN